MAFLPTPSRKGGTPGQGFRPGAPTQWTMLNTKTHPPGPPGVPAPATPRTRIPPSQRQYYIIPHYSTMSLQYHVIPLTFLMSFRA